MQILRLRFPAYSSPSRHRPPIAEQRAHVCSEWPFENAGTETKSVAKLTNENPDARPELIRGVAADVLIPRNRFLAKLDAPEANFLHLQRR